MSVKIVLDSWSDEPCYKKEIIESNLDSNLVAVIEDALGGEEHLLSFDHYYHNKYCMMYERCMPYIIRDDSIIWNLSYNQISINDFIRTHDIPDNGTIEVDVDKIPGKGDFLVGPILGWIQFCIKCYGYGAACFKSIDFICKHFVGDNHKVIDIYDVIDFILRKIKWKMTDLTYELRCDDVDLLEKLLSTAGYNYNNGQYEFSGLTWDAIIDRFTDGVDPWEVDPIKKDYEGIAFNLSQINRYISVLKFADNTISAPYYNIARSMADQLITVIKTFVHMN